MATCTRSLPNEPPPPSKARRLRLPTHEELEFLHSVLGFEPGEALEPGILKQEVDALHALRLLLALGVGAPRCLEPARVRARDLRLLRGVQPSPLFVRDLAMKGRMHGEYDVLEGEVRQRSAPTAVWRQRRANDLDVDRPLRDRVAHDAYARHLRVRSGLLEIVCAERRDLVSAWSGASLDHQVGDRKIDVEVLRDDFAVDEVVQLWTGEIQRREPPSRGVGVVRSGYVGPRRDCHCRLHWGKGRSVE